MIGTVKEGMAQSSAGRSRTAASPSTRGYLVLVLLKFQIFQGMVLIFICECDLHLFPGNLWLH